MADVVNTRIPKTTAAATDSELDKVALAGAAAIQQIIADRDQLRKYVDTQRRELVALTAVNENLRRTITLIRHHYIELGTKILRELEQFDEAFSSVTFESKDMPDVSQEQANLVALAQRLKPVVRNSGERPA